MYLAIDTMIDKMENQIKKLKDRVTNHQKHSIKEQFDKYSRASLFQTNGEPGKKKLVKTKRVMPETLSVQEAMDKLKTLEDGYLIFKNVETDGISVLVRKNEDEYKLFEP